MPQATTPWRRSVPINVPTVVKIESGSSVGTGFCIDNFILTAAHTLSNAPLATVHTQAGQTFQVRVIAKHPTADVAVLDASTVHNPRWSVRQFSAPAIGSTASMTGYEGGKILTTLSGAILSPDSVQMSRIHQPGMSGSPVYSGQSIVGLHYGDTGTAAHFVPWTVIGPFLQTLPVTDDGEGVGNGIGPILPPVNRYAEADHTHDFEIPQSLVDDIANQVRQEFLNQSPEVLMTVIRNVVKEELKSVVGSPGPPGPAGTITVSLYENGRPTKTVSGVKSGSTVKLPVTFN